MTTYQGPVAVVTRGGERHGTRGALYRGVAGNPLGWHGELEVELLAVPLPVGSCLLLHLPDGRSGYAIVTGDGGQIIGKGPAPFGDLWDDLAARFAKRITPTRRG